MTEESKTDRLERMLSAGWCKKPDLMASMTWGDNTLRGAISTLAKKTGKRAERRTADGVTEYRLVPREVESL